MESVDINRGLGVQSEQQAVGIKQVKLLDRFSNMDVKVDDFSIEAIQWHANV